MSGSEFDRPEIMNAKTLDSASRLPAYEPGTDVDERNPEPLLQAEKLSVDIERFSRISLELTETLGRISREVKAAAEELERIESAVAAKKKELKTLHGIEATAVALERLVLDHQRQKESLDRLIAEQRALWEQEKTDRSREEREYQDQLRVRREREEEAYRQQWAADRLKAQQKLEEELRVIQQETLEKQQALERDCLERELKLKEKELEWVQLIQELEQFMSKLTRRAQGQTAPVTASAPPAELLEEPKSAVSSLKEMLVSQGQRIENLKS